MKKKAQKFFNLKDMILAAIIIGLLVFTFIPADVAEKEGGAAFGTMKEGGQSVLTHPTPETPAPTTAE